MIRKATLEDINLIATLYDRVIDYQAANGGYMSWVKNVYPTQKTASDALSLDTLYVYDANGNVIQYTDGHLKSLPAIAYNSYNTQTIEYKLVYLTQELPDYYKKIWTNPGFIVELDVLTPSIGDVNVTIPLG